MRNLFIIRHAIAEERDASRWPDDDERPLTKEGARRFRKVARGLQSALGRPDALWTSHLVRAQQTARILEKEARYPAAEEVEQLRPDEKTERLVAKLRTGKWERLALVGHEPSLGLLVRALVRGADEQFDLSIKKGGLVWLQFDGRVGEGQARLQALAPPRLLRAMRR